MYFEDKFLKVICGNIDGQTLSIFFNLIDNNLVERWISLVNFSNDSNYSLTYTYGKINSQNELIERLYHLNSLIETINSQYIRQLPLVESIEWLIKNPHILNDLHEEYEKYGESVNKFKLNKTMIELNNVIHEFESILQNIKTPEKKLCDSLIDWFPTGLHKNLEPEDYFLFDSQQEWGEIFLGYNTLGKSWIPVMHDNDIDVVKRNMIKPQKRFSAEFYIHFQGKPTITHFNNNKFYNWWKKNNISQYYDPDVKLSEFAFGFIPLGKIYAFQKDNEKLIVCDNAINTYEQKLHWNKEYWSKYSTILSASIIKGNICWD